MFISSVFIIFVSVWIYLYGKYSYCIQVVNAQTASSKARDCCLSLDFYLQFLCPHMTSECPSVTSVYKSPINARTPKHLQAVYVLTFHIDLDP